MNDNIDVLLWNEDISNKLFNGDWINIEGDVLGLNEECSKVVMRVVMQNETSEFFNSYFLISHSDTGSNNSINMPNISQPRSTDCVDNLLCPIYTLDHNDYFHIRQLTFDGSKSGIIYLQWGYKKLMESMPFTFAYDL